MHKYISIMRPHQYVKNLFIFAPLFFSFRMTEIDLVMHTAIGFAAFSFLASSIYIFNDIVDLEYDRGHPEKKNRPIASGGIPVARAVVFGVLLITAGGAIAALLVSDMLAYILAYVLLNAAYTLKLKHLPIVDVFIIAAGFVIRILIGGAIGNIAVSMWLVLMTFLLALFLALAKRRDDVIAFLDSGEKYRQAVDGYNIQTLDASLIMMASVTVVSYIMYTISPEVTGHFKSRYLYLTVVFVIFGFMRYFDIVFVEKKSGSPTMVLLKDWLVRACVLGWILTFAVVVYYAR